ILMGLVVVVFCAGFLLPAQVHVERQIVINAPAEQVFAHVGDLQQWNDWSPWAKIDANTEMKVSGSGVGQQMTWASDNPEVGSGSQQITQIDAPNTLQTHLEFDGQGLADATFNLVPEADGTRITWGLNTNVRENTPFLFKPISSYAGLLLDSLVGADYENGLQSLKQLVEAE
ncbi:SRPBCC family protein, partial [filamentous cyanobacterium LEGE 11480]